MEVILSAKYVWRCEKDRMLKASDWSLAKVKISTSAAYLHWLCGNKFGKNREKRYQKEEFWKQEKFLISLFNAPISAFNLELINFQCKILEEQREKGAAVKVILTKIYTAYKSKWRETSELKQKESWNIIKGTTEWLKANGRIKIIKKIKRKWDEKLLNA